MRRNAGVKASGSRQRAAELVREALSLLDDDEGAALHHVQAALAVLEDGMPPYQGNQPANIEVRGGAFARAIGMMAAIVERAAKDDGPHCVNAIARAMEDYGQGIASQDLSAALLLDQWARIVRDQAGLVEPVGRRDN